LETGEEIGIKRLEARPVATLSVEAQERRERREKQYGDRDDRYR
jgi:DnaK suppressor protein